jgi:acyl carrier protein
MSIMEEKRAMVTAEAVPQHQVVESMIKLLARILRTDATITAETRLVDELGLTSSQGVELTLELEDDLSILIDVEDLDDEDASTVGELATYVATHSTAR